MTSWTSQRWMWGGLSLVLHFAAISGLWLGASFACREAGLVDEIVGVVGPRFGRGFMTWLVIAGSASAGWTPYAVLDSKGWLQRYRIHGTAIANESAKDLCKQLVIRNFVLLLFVTTASAPILDMLFPFKGAPVHVLQLPGGGEYIQDNRLGGLLGFKTMCRCFPVFFVMHDLWFYAYHRFLHTNKQMYKRFHKIHHTFTVPFAMTSHALHPVEMLLQSVGALMGPLYFGASIETLWLWLVIVQLQGIDDHTGYEFPWALSRVMAIHGGTPVHDNHHAVNKGNYAACFSVIDRAFGTYIPPSAPVNKGR
jgi:sterol desaturase/sphingolipid hydroxylase (fatty acid hydroxylase superfamily)